MPTLFHSVPTGAIYGVHATESTRAEGISTINVENLVGALQYSPVDHTAVTPQHGWLVDSFRDPPVDVFAFLVATSRLCLECKVFDPTPSVIERTRSEAFVATPEAVSDPPPAYEAFKDLGRWLDADDAAIADMVGVGRTTPYAWKRDGREPRAATTQRIYEYHATLDSLRRRLGISGLRRWTHEGVASRRDMLLAGDLGRLEADVHELLFRRGDASRVDLAAAPEDTSAVHTTRGERPLRPSGRRPRRAGG